MTLVERRRRAGTCYRRRCGEVAEHVTLLEAGSRYTMRTCGRHHGDLISWAVGDHMVELVRDSRITIDSRVVVAAR